MCAGSNEVFASGAGWDVACMAVAAVLSLTALIRALKSAIETCTVG